MRVPFQRENRFVAYLERKWRWIPICKYPSRYDFLSYKQKNIPPVGNMHTRWHEEIMPSPGNSIRGAWPYSIVRFSRLASLSILWIPPLVASGRKTAKYRNSEYPQKPGKEGIAKRAKKKTEPWHSNQKWLYPMRWSPVIYRTHEITYFLNSVGIAILTETVPAIGSVMFPRL